MEEKIRELLEKSYPANVKEYDSCYKCPRCGQLLSMKYKGLCVSCLKVRYYCSNCGQLLNWENIKDEV